MLSKDYLTYQPIFMNTTSQDTRLKLPGILKQFAATTTDGNLHHLAFDNAAQANVITMVSSGKIIAANNAACKLLGYSEKELLTGNRATIFDISEKGFKKMLTQRTSTGQSKASVTAIHKNGKLLPCEISSAVFMNEAGIENSITSITDMRQSLLNQKDIDTKNEKVVADNIVLAILKQKSIDIKNEKKVARDIILALARSDARLVENCKWIKYIVNVSYDVMWDWNLLTNELFIDEGIEGLFGYVSKNNKGNISDKVNYIHTDDKEAYEKGLHDAIASTATHWEQTYRFMRSDGSVTKVFDRASIIRDPDGKACRMIGAMQDISRKKEMQEKLNHAIVAKGLQLAEYKENFRLIFNSSSDVLYDSDLVTNEIIISNAYEKEFGYKITGHMKLVEDWLDHIHPDDKEAVFQNYFRVLSSKDTEWKYSYRFLRADDSVANVFSTGIILRNADGKACRMIGHMQDVSKQKVLEESLEREIKLKEKQIVEAMEEARDTERSDIGKELHDNINQLLVASRMYLEMARQGGGKSEIYLSRSSEYTLTAIEEIRKLSKGLTTDIIQNLGLCEAIEKVALDTMEVNPVKISCISKTFKEHSVNDKFKLNIFRIVQEQLNNIIKHAGATKVAINLSQNDQSIMLQISDNGIGFDTTKKRNGIGIDNIKSRTAVYNGTADFVSQPGHGCALTVIFPDADVQLPKPALC